MAIPPMNLSFTDDELRKLCNSRSLLRARFGPGSEIVERRLLTLADARVLREVSTRAPDRRRNEPALGKFAASVCISEAGRIYFKACGLELASEVDFDEIDQIEIFKVGRRNG